MQSCHEVEIYADDTLACASITATALFDLSGRLRRPRHAERLHRRQAARHAAAVPRARLVDRGRPSSAPPPRSPTASTAAATTAPQRLTVSEWLKIGAPSLEGVEVDRHRPAHGLRRHAGHRQHAVRRDRWTSSPRTSREITESGKFVITTDERGGGTVPGGATLHARRRQRARQRRPPRLPGRQLHDDAADDGRGGPEAVGARLRGRARDLPRADAHATPQGSFCTAHVFQLIPGQNRIFMGWYSQGTQVVDFVENADGTIDFKRSPGSRPRTRTRGRRAIFKVQENPDGSFTYWGATGDGILPGTGRVGDRRLQGHAPGPRRGDARRRCQTGHASLLQAAEGLRAAVVRAQLGLRPRRRHAARPRPRVLLQAPRLAARRSTSSASPRAGASSASGG